MITTERLYELGFRFREERPWENIYDTEVYGIRFHDGETGYICTMGAMGTFFGMALYMGDEGLRNAYRMMIRYDEPKSLLAEIEEGALQDCIQIILGDEYDLEPMEDEYILSYAKKHGYDMSGENAFPYFRRLLPGRVPWSELTAEDEEHLAEAITAVLMMGKMVKTNTPDELGIHDLRECGGNLIYVEIQDGKLSFSQGFEDLTKSAADYPMPDIDEFTASRMKKIRTEDIWECEIVMIPEPVVDDENEELFPFYPYTMMMISRDTGEALFVEIVKNCREDAEELLRNVVDAIVRYGACPSRIMARDERTFCFLKRFSDAVGSEIMIEEELPALDAFEQNFMDNVLSGEEDFDLSELEGLFDIILGMDEKDIQNMPEEMRETLLELYIEKDVPPQLAEKLHKILEKTGHRPIFS